MTVTSNQRRIKSASAFNGKTKLILITLAVIVGVCNVKWDTILDILAIILHVCLKPSDELSHSDKKIAYEATLEATALIQFNDYPAENHMVVTKDGYILKLHRIPFGKKNNTGGGIPVYLQHGLMSCSPQWINNGDESLAFVLADNGYDVWLGNFRGNRYSNHHTYLSKNNLEFWRYGWDKLAKYDVPAMIDYIRFATGYDQILTIGHSMGFNAIACALANQPKLNNKVIGLIGLGPAVKTRYTFSLLKLFSSTMHLMRQLTSSKCYFKYSKQWEDIVVRLCPSSSSSICSHILNFFTGFNPDLYNQTRIPIYTIHVMCGSSIFILYQLNQLLLTTTMLGYDYGKEQNKIEYGQDLPVQYNFSNIRVPIGILHSINDGMSSTVSNALLAREIPHIVGYKLLPGVMTTHNDFTMSKRNVVNRIVLRWFRRMLIKYVRYFGSYNHLPKY